MLSSRRILPSITKLRPSCSTSSRQLPTNTLRKAPLSSTAAAMSDIKTVSTPDAMQPAGPYSQAKVTPIGIFVSGQIPANKDGSLVEGSIGQKTEACIRSLKTILEAAGSSIERVVKVNVFISDMAYFAEMNDEYAKWFTTKPARSCVAVKTLPKNVDVEIECIAAP